MSTATPQIRREFLGWDRPALAEAARLLAKQYRDDHSLNLGNVIIVTPGKRAGRRLQELLAYIAEDEKLILTPPEVVTEGTLLEYLYTPKFPFADEITQDMAWAKALHELADDTRRHIVPRSPEAGDVLAWLKLGGVIRRVHVELAADGVDFASVVACGPKLKGFAEHKRWHALVKLQERYHQTLDAEKLWDIQTARLKAIEFKEIQTERDIVLIGTVDLNKTLRRMLDLVSPRVIAYVVAPQDRASMFDSHGCLEPAAWCNEEVPLRDDQLQQVEGPAEQAQTVTDWLGSLNGKYRADQVAVGVTDESLVPHLQRQLEQCGVKGRWVEGTRFGESGPYHLLAAAVKYAGQKRYEDFAALIRHPDVEDWLESTESGVRSAESKVASLPAQLDRLYNERLPSRIDARSILQNDHWPDLALATQRIAAWLKEASGKHRLREWRSVFCRLLGEIYGARKLNLEMPADQVLHSILCRIIEACEQIESVPESLDRMALSAADVFEIVLGPLAKTALPPPADPEAVEILGWLELPLDDSEALVVTSFNEGFVPKSVTADAFLPDTLRRELGIEHNQRRYARDAYATTVLCHGRKQLCMVFARRNADEHPLQPSRLVFACDEQSMPQRAMNFFGPSRQITNRRPLLTPAGHQLPDRSRFEVPKPTTVAKKLQHISVTRFKHYLACPYRYYLRFVENLEGFDDSVRELDGGAFGTLLHGVLSAFGRDKRAPRQSEHDQELFAYLSDTLSTLARRRYGEAGHRVSIRMQIEQARVRLKAFAQRQAVQTQEGWQIIYAEEERSDGEHEITGIEFPVDGERVILVGHIDRLDYHEKRHCVRILDYKTADTAERPEKTHRDGDKWIDLQLPLYRHLWTCLKTPINSDCAIELGYFNLPKRFEETKVAIAAWSEADLQDADETAREVIRGLLKNAFGGPVYPAPNYSDDFAAICLDNVFDGPAYADDKGGNP